VTEMSY